MKTLLTLLIVLIASTAYSWDLRWVQPSGGARAIDNITVHVRAKILNTNETGALTIRLRTEAPALQSSAYKDLTTSYQNFTYPLDTNPDDSAAWENTDLDGVTIGVATGNIDNEIDVTQIWLVVTWTDTSTDTYRMDDTSSPGVWVNEADSGVNIHLSIDEVSTDDDTTYIKSSSDWQGCEFVVEDPVK